jgi:hypothetical protein
VKEQVQAYLAESLAKVRSLKGTRMQADPQVIVANFTGSVAALRFLGEVTVEEEEDWARRLHVALEIAPKRWESHGTRDAEAFSYVGTSTYDKDPVPRFLRSIPGPNVEYELYGGRLRIIAVEIYDTGFNLRWHAAPEPSVLAAFPEDFRLIDRDLDGIEWRKAALVREKFNDRLRGFRLYQFDVSDDVDTQYRKSGDHHGGSINGITGEAAFVPTPPANASVLRIGWFGAEIRLPLS